MANEENRSRNSASQERYLPAVDALETNDELVLIADIPGVTAETLEVTVEQGVLTLLGRVEPAPVESKEVLQQEFLQGDYYRQFRLPRDFSTDTIDASLKGGVVTIRIPREEKSRPRKITVRTE